MEKEKLNQLYLHFVKYQKGYFSLTNSSWS